MAPNTNPPPAPAPAPPKPFLGKSAPTAVGAPPRSRTALGRAGAGQDGAPTTPAKPKPARAPKGTAVAKGKPSATAPVGEPAPPPPAAPPGNAPADAPANAPGRDTRGGMRGGRGPGARKRVKLDEATMDLNVAMEQNAFINRSLALEAAGAAKNMNTETEKNSVESGGLEVVGAKTMEETEAEKWARADVINLTAVPNCVFDSQPFDPDYDARLVKIEGNAVGKKRVTFHTDDGGNRVWVTGSLFNPIDLLSDSDAELEELEAMANAAPQFAPGSRARVQRLSETAELVVDLDAHSNQILVAYRDCLRHLESQMLGRDAFFTPSAALQSMPTVGQISKLKKTLCDTNKDVDLLQPRPAVGPPISMEGLMSLNPCMW